MKKIIITKRQSQITRHAEEVSESLERKMEKILAGKETVEMVRTTIYQPRSEGVNHQYNIRADRWDIAQGAVDSLTRDSLLKRENWVNPKESKKKGVSDTAESTPVNI